MTGGNGIELADRPFHALARLFGAIGRMPGSAWLADLIATAAAEVIAARRSAAGDLGARLAAGDDTARTELAALADGGFDALREAVRAGARERGVMFRAAVAFDRAWNDTDEVEYLDDPDFDQGQRLRIMDNLDRMNGVIGSYSGFVDALEPLLVADRATRILDLAAGHGGFCLAAARIARERGDAIDFTASDLKTEYLELAAEHARAEGLPIDFVHQDALDLSNLTPGAYDIITCTQSLHHFTPGMVAVMFEAASRAAGRGVVFIDACRSTLVGLALATYGLVRCRQPAFAHDSWVSSRRFFMPEELGMLARIGPWGDAVEAIWVPPGHCMLRLACD